MEEFDVIVELISEFLGDPKKVYENRSQISFNCIECDEDRGKGNLEVNVNKSVFHCWSCGISGPLKKLFDLYATKKQKKLFSILVPDEVSEQKEKKIKLKLPEGYTKFSDSNPRYPPHREALNYLYSRGITDEMISKFGIGYTMQGDYSGRIIVPSFDGDGNLNYFIGRSWGKSKKFKYKNPIAEKDKIIFWENLINWEKDVYLVEGVFDGMFLENSIPMLGKHLSVLLFNTLYDKLKGDIIIVLDGDAWKDAVKLYRELNGGKLYNKIKIIKLPSDKDVCDLKGNINEYFFEIK